jgi:hypothetical protein
MAEWPKWCPNDLTNPQGKGQLTISYDLGRELYEAVKATRRPGLIHRSEEWKAAHQRLTDVLARYEREVEPHASRTQEDEDSA